MKVLQTAEEIADAPTGWYLQHVSRRNGHLVKLIGPLTSPEASEMLDRLIEQIDPVHGEATEDEVSIIFREKGACG